MKRLLLMCVVGVFAAQVANAATIGPGVNDTVIIDLGIWDPTTGDNRQFITGDCFSTGGNAQDQLACLNAHVIPRYNTFNDANAPDLVTATFGTENINTPGEPLSLQLNVTNYDYLKIKWDGLWQYYFLGNQTGVVTFHSTVLNPAGTEYQAASHYTFMSPTTTSVPDGGATLGLLGSALFGLGLFGRRKK